MDKQALYSISPYMSAKKEKENFLTDNLRVLSIHHYDECLEYRRMMNAVGFDPHIHINSYYDIPPLPVRLFKELPLKSVPDEQVSKLMKSSGTTGQQVSKIFLDKQTASLQSNIGVKNFSAFLRIKRLPLVLVDSISILTSRSEYSARGAASLFYSLFGSDKIYALDDNMNLDLDALLLFLQKHKGEKILFFGFTFMVWQHLCQALREKEVKLDIADGILIHGGGWKKLASENITNDLFKSEVKHWCNVSHVCDSYGMAEQSGVVNYECEYGHLHTSAFADIIVRNKKDMTLCGIGEPGIIEGVSVLPWSYPGHALLTEDEGVIIGEDNCQCGRKGKYFKVLGRLKEAEIRGCSDTYATSI